MDRFDIALLEALQSDSRRSMNELGEQIGLSSSPQSVRLSAIKQGWVGISLPVGAPAAVSGLQSSSVATSSRYPPSPGERRSTIVVTPPSEGVGVLLGTLHPISDRGVNISEIVKTRSLTARLAAGIAALVLAIVASGLGLIPGISAVWRRSAGWMRASSGRSICRSSWCRSC